MLNLNHIVPKLSRIVPVASFALLTLGFAATASAQTVWNAATNCPSPIPIPNDNNDDAPSLNACLVAFRNALNSSGQTGTLNLQAGTYRLSTNLHLTYLNTGLTITGAAGGTRTVLLATTPEKGILLAEYAKNVTVARLDVDYNPLPFTQGTVSNVDHTNKTFELTLDPGFPLLEEPFFNVSGRLYFGVYHAPDVPGRIAWNTTDHVQLTPNYNSWQRLNASNPSEPPRYRLWVTNTINLTSGTKFTYLLRGDHIFTSSASPGTATFDDVTVFAGGLVFVAVGSEKMVVKNSKILMKPGRIQSTNGDGVHAQACKFGPTVTNNYFEGMADDAVNIYGVAFKIWADEGQNTYLVQTDQRPVHVGDYLQVQRRSSGALGNLVQVTEIKEQWQDPNIGWIVRLKVNQSLWTAPTTVALLDDRFYNNNWMGDGFDISNNQFREFRGRGVMARAKNGNISGNFFFALAGEAIMIDVEEPIEGLQAKNVTVKNNTMRSCGMSYNFANDPRSGIIKIGARNGANSTAFAMYHHNITIEGNLIDQWARHAMYIGSAGAVTINSNTLTNPDWWLDPVSGHRGVIFFEFMAPSSVTNNTISDERIGATAPTGKFWYFNMPAGNISLSGNSFSPANTHLPEFQQASAY